MENLKKRIKEPENDTSFYLRKFLGEEKSYKESKSTIEDLGKRLQIVENDIELIYNTKKNNGNFYNTMYEFMNDIKIQNIEHRINIIQTKINGFDEYYAEYIYDLHK